MKAKIQKGGYTTLDSFWGDVNLMWTNCMKFNPKSTVFFQEALRLQNECKKYRIEANNKLNPPKKRKITDISSAGGDRKAMLNRSQPVTPIKTGEDFKPELISACMLLAQPTFLSFIYVMATESLHECQRKMTLPLEHPMLPSILQLLQLAVIARIQTLASKQCDIGIPAPDQYILRVLCPTFLHFCMFNPLSSSEKKDGDSAVDDRLIDCWKDEIMSKLMGYYAKKLNRLGDKETYERIRSNVPRGKENNA